MELLCKWCGETKPAEAMVRRDTKLPYSQQNTRCCKVCNTQKNRERYTDPSIRAKQLQANAKWRRENPVLMAQYTKDFYERNPAKQQARSRVGYLVRNGYWTRQPCCVCGSEEQVEAHHDSYAKPHWDSVRWLCKAHHEKWHQVLDPVKEPMLEPLEEVESIRQSVVEKLEEVRKLRAEIRDLENKADSLELKTWNAVVEVAANMFKDFA